MVTVVAIVASKGGVGKSTVAANLIVALQKAGRAVLGVDLDPQNALHLHLGGNPEDIGGLARASVANTPWRDAVSSFAPGLYVLPFGQVNETDLQTLERQIAGDPHWLAEHIDGMGLSDEALVILDTPPGPSDYLRQALSVANLVIAVMLADAASYAALPMIEGLIHQYCDGRPDYIGGGYLINQVDGAHRLSKDAVQVVRGALGEGVIGVVHEDQAVSEALANGRTVIETDPHSQARADLIACADWVRQRLPESVEAA
jgi:cellulose synthase operon protein YhjQ